jgi:hypothetical protein
VNLYAYAGNNPISFSDPFGLCWPMPACLGEALARMQRDFTVAVVGTLEAIGEISGVSGFIRAVRGTDEGGEPLGAGERIGELALAGAAAVPGDALAAGSGRLLAEARAGLGARVIAGAGHVKGNAIRDVARLVSEYGGEAGDWSKRSGRSLRVGGKTIEVHWYENVTTGERVEFKTKLAKGWE